MNGSGMKLDGKKKKEWLLGLKIGLSWELAPAQI
jgi:hypothetical protein